MNYKKIDLKLIEDFVMKKHSGQVRRQGTPYYLHPFSVRDIVKSLGYGEDFQAAALMHDLLEDTNSTYQEIEDISSREVLDAVIFLTKEKGYVMEEYIEGIKSNSIAKIVKLADRVHNLEEAVIVDSDFKNKYIKETKIWYVDLAKNTNLEEMLIKNLMLVEKSLYN